MIKAELAGTSQECPYSPGSVRTLYVARASDVYAVPQGYGGSVPDTISPPDPDIWEEYHFQLDQAQFQEAPLIEGQTTAYRLTVTGQHTSFEEAGRKEIANLQDGHYILKAELYTGATLLIGSPDRPAIFEAGSNTGRTRRDTLRSNWKFTAVGRFPVTQLQPAGPFDCSALDSSEFSVAFNTTGGLGGGTIDSVTVALAPQSQIASITNRPSALLEVSISGGLWALVDTLTWDGTSYTPDGGPVTYVNGAYRIRIPGQSVTVQGGTTCVLEVAYTQLFVVVAPQPSFTWTIVAGSSIEFQDTTILFGQTVTARRWDFGDGTTDNSGNVTPLHDYTTAPPFTVTMEIDVDGTTYTATEQVTFAGPAAVFTYSPNPSEATQAISFDGSSSVGSGLTYMWDFGDGTTSVVSQPSHTYAQAGTYTVTLTVTDGASLQDTYIQVLTVQAPPNIPPVATNVQISPVSPALNLYAGAAAQITYTYSDAEGDTQSGTVVNLYRSDDASGTNELLTGTTTLSGSIYTAEVATPTEANNFYVRAEVIPANTNGTGTSQFSGYVQVQVIRPVVDTVAFEFTPQVGVELAFSYNYTHAGNVAEGASTAVVKSYTSAEDPNSDLAGTIVYSGAASGLWTPASWNIGEDNAGQSRARVFITPVDANGLYGNAVGSAVVNITPATLASMAAAAGIVGEYDFSAGSSYADAQANFSDLAPGSGATPTYDAGGYYILEETSDVLLFPDTIAAPAEHTLHIVFSVWAARAGTEAYVWPNGDRGLLARELSSNNQIRMGTYTDDGGLEEFPTQVSVPPTPVRVVSLRYQAGQFSGYINGIESVAFTPGGGISDIPGYFINGTTYTLSEGNIHLHGFYVQVGSISEYEVLQVINLLITRHGVPL